MKKYIYLIVLRVVGIIILFYFPFLCFAQTPLDESLDRLSYQELDSIGKELRNNSKFYEAEPYLKKALQKIEKSNGKDSLYAVACREVGILYFFQSRFIEVETLFLEAKDTQRNIFGENDIEYARSCNALGVLYSQQKLFQKAEILYLESLRIKKEKLGEESSEYAKTSLNLGVLYRNKGLYLKAEPFFISVKEVFEKQPESVLYVNACAGLAGLYEEITEYKKAEKLYIEAKNMQLNYLGKENRDYAGSCYNLGRLYIKIGNYEKAESLVLEAASINEIILGKKSFDYSLIHKLRADLYLYQKLYQKAEPLYKEVIENQKNQIKLLFPIYSESEKQEYYSAHSNFFLTPLTKL
jgi:tetratricopeptide (TPR) repeat protein